MNQDRSSVWKIKKKKREEKRKEGKGWSYSGWKGEKIVREQY